MEWDCYNCSPNPVLAGGVCSNSYNPGISLVYGKEKSLKMVQNGSKSRRKAHFCSSYTMRVIVAMSRYTLY